MIVDIKFDEDNCSINPDFTESDCNVNINFEQVNVISSGKGAVKTVNGISPDENGNVEIEIPECDAVKTVNGKTPDKNGNVEVDALPNELEQITMLIEADMLPVVHDANGAILTDENGNIVMRY